MDPSSPCGAPTPPPGVRIDPPYIDPSSPCRATHAIASRALFEHVRRTTRPVDPAVWEDVAQAWGTAVPLPGEGDRDRTLSHTLFAQPGWDGLASRNEHGH